MTKVSVLPYLRTSGCELKYDYNVSFILLFKTNLYRYIVISVIFLSSNAGFLSPVRDTHFTQFEKGILCPKS